MNTTPLFTFALAVTLVIGCASPDSSSEAPIFVIGQGTDTFPSESLTDWVSYADQVSVVDVVAERRIPPPREVRERGEGYIGREVTLQIRSNIWAQKGIEPREGTIALNAAGWILREGDQLSMAVVEGAPRIEVGHQLLLPLARGPEGDLGLMSGSAVMVLSAGKVDVQEGQENAAVASLDGLSTEMVGRALRGTQVDPRALAHWELDPYERSQAVLDDAEAGRSATESTRAG